jgi:predicted RecA/RadA family phage recombinase
MKNYRHPGEVLTYTAPSGGVVSGNGYLIGVTFGVATIDAAVGTKFTMQVKGVVNLPKLSTDVVAEGVALYWDNTAKLLTVTTTSNTLVGVAEGAAGNGVATVDILLAR